MTAGTEKRGFATRPANPDNWIKAGDAPPPRTDTADAYSARLTVDITPALRGRIKIAAFQRGVTVADMLRDLFRAGVPTDRWRNAMTGFQPGRMGGHALPDDAPAFTTLVHLTWEDGRIEHRIRFGRPIYQRTIDRRSRVVGFAPNSVFAFVRWASNEYGTVVSRIDILRAIGRGEPFQTLPFVRPGGDLLLKLHGWPKVERALQLVDAIEALGIDAADAAPAYWRHVHNRLTAGLEPRLYTREQHDAWRTRRSILP